MSNVFLSSGSSSVQLTNGQAVLNIASVVCQNFTANLPIRADVNKKLVSGLISVSDLSFVPLTNPYAGTLTATDVATGAIASLNTLGGSVSSLTTKTTNQTYTAGTTDFSGTLTSAGSQVALVSQIPAIPSLTSAGSAVGTLSLIKNGTAPNFTTRGIVAGTGLQLASALNDITMNTTTSISDAGSGTISLIGSTSTNPAFTFRKLTAGTGIGLSVAGDVITISDVDVSETLSSAGTVAGTQSLVANGTAPNFTIKGLAIAASGGLNIQSTSTDIILSNASPASSVTISTAGGANSLIASTSVNPAFGIRSLAAGSGVSMLTASDVLTISTIATTITSVGGANSLIGSTSAYPGFTIRSLAAGTGVTLTTASDVLTIAATGVTLASIGTAVGTQSLVGSGAGPNLTVRGLAYTTGMTIVSTANDLIFSNSSPASAITLASAGGSTSLIGSASANPAFTVRSLAAGTGVTLATASDVVTIAATTQTFNSVGGGVSLVGNSSAYPNWLIRSLQVGQGIAITLINDLITLTNTVAVATVGAGTALLGAGSLFPNYTVRSLAPGLNTAVSVASDTITVAGTAALTGLTSIAAPAGLTMSIGSTLAITAIATTITNDLQQLGLPYVYWTSNLPANNSVSLTGGGFQNIGWTSLQLSGSNFFTLSAGGQATYNGTRTRLFLINVVMAFLADTAAQHYYLACQGFSAYCGQGKLASSTDGQFVLSFIAPVATGTVLQIAMRSLTAANISISQTNFVAYAIGS